MRGHGNAGSASDDLGNVREVTRCDLSTQVVPCRLEPREAQVLCDTVLPRPGGRRADSATVHRKSQLLVAHVEIAEHRLLLLDCERPAQIRVTMEGVRRESLRDAA